MELNYKSMKVVELKAALEELGLNTSGLKAELVKRLETHDASTEAKEEYTSEEVAAKDLTNAADRDTVEGADEKDAVSTRNCCVVLSSFASCFLLF